MIDSEVPKGKNIINLFGSMFIKVDDWHVYSGHMSFNSKLIPFQKGRKLIHSVRRNVTTDCSQSS